MWEGVGDRTEMQHIDLPTLLAITAFLSRSPGLLKRGPVDPASLGAGFLYGILSLTRLIPNCSVGGPGTPSARCWLSLPHLVTNWSGLQTDWISCALRYIIVQHPPSSCGHHNFALIQPVHGQGNNILIIPRPDAPIIYTGAFPILTARPGRRSMYNTTSLVWWTFVWERSTDVVSSPSLTIRIYEKWQWESRVSPSGHSPAI